MNNTEKATGNSWEGSYTVKLFNEECNGDNLTDFASSPISIPLAVDNTPPTVSGGIDPVLTVTVTESEGWENPFEDVEEDDWFYGDVKYVWENGIIQGTSGTAFAPQAAVSRAMVVAVLWRMEGEPEATGKNPFTDLTQEWYTEAVIWAASTGIVEGYDDGLFGPDDDITREQLATILYRYVQYNGGGFKGAWMFLLEYADRDEISGHTRRSATAR